MIVYQVDPFYQEQGGEDHSLFRSSKREAKALAHKILRDPVARENMLSMVRVFLVELRDQPPKKMALLCLNYPSDGRSYLPEEERRVLIRKEEIWSANV